jgi:flagellar biogenesis protein FliO
MDVMRQIAAVAAVLAMLTAALWGLRRRGFGGARFVRGSKAGRRLECLERLPLSPQHTLHLVRWGDAALLVASSPAGCTLIGSFPSAQIDSVREPAP